MTYRHPSRASGQKERRAAAENLVVEALGFIAAEPERLGRFLAITGIGPDSIRAAARDAHFLAGVLDYVLEDDLLLRTFAGEAGIDPNNVSRARELLAGRRWKRDTP